MAVDEKVFPKFCSEGELMEKGGEKVPEDLINLSVKNENGIYRLIPNSEHIKGYKVYERMRVNTTYHAVFN